MQEQYNKLKQQHQDAVLLFRLGDFYEAFNEDAELISEILGLTLTGRGKGEKRIPMAGIPHHALNNYVPKLVEAGIKIAIADQVEEAVQGQLVDRQVTKLITSGTITDDSSLKAGVNNYIASVVFRDNNFYVAFADITTGSLSIFETKSVNNVARELNKLEVSELLSDSLAGNILQNKLKVNILEKEYFNLKDNLAYLKNYFETETIKGLGISDESQFVNAIASLLRYGEHTQRKSLNHITKIEKKNFSDYMQLDESTIANLELLYPIQTSGDLKATVFAMINKTLTAMGQRMLRYWLVNPLINSEKLQARLDS
ncbi:hypothetical protein KC669_04505, partial [Candidatus Dojkabacteria bacterium]|nr:hypothetical protein [Candidatus Dojkabacteria bacterium]